MISPVAFPFILSSQIRDILPRMAPIFKIQQSLIRVLRAPILPTQIYEAKVLQGRMLKIRMASGPETLSSDVIPKKIPVR